MNADTPTMIAWELYYDGRGGLKMEVFRRFVLFEDWVVVGITNLESGALEWSATKLKSAESARDYALRLTQAAEDWGCDLSWEPRYLVLEGDQRVTRIWLERLRNSRVMSTGLDQLIEHTFSGTPIAA